MCVSALGQREQGPPNECVGDGPRMEATLCRGEATVADGACGDAGLQAEPDEAQRGEEEPLSREEAVAEARVREEVITHSFGKFVPTLS